MWNLDIGPLRRLNAIQPLAVAEENFFAVDCNCGHFDLFLLGTLICADRR
jgi:hypothetical protein